MMDNGGYYCFCNLYGGCEAAAKVPMHVTIDLLQKYVHCFVAVDAAGEECHMA